MGLTTFCLFSLTIFLIVQNSSTQTNTIKLTQTDPTYLWKITDQTEEIVIQVDPQFTISVNISDVDLKESNYLFIKNGLVEDDGTKDGRAFANSVAKPRTMLFRSSSVFGKFYMVNTKDVGNTANVLFELTDTYGPEPTPIPTTTTEDSSWPTTQITDSIYTNVFVAGKTLAQFKDVNLQNQFKQCLAEMATQYCSDQQINVLEPITLNNVFLTSIAACPSSWPKTETCVAIKFKLPIIHDSEKWDGYLLDTKHLDIMWLRQENILKNYNLSVYKEPNYEIAITWWMIGILAVLFCFIGLLWILREFSIHFNARRKKQKESETQNIVERKPSQISLEAHYLQPN